MHSKLSASVGIVKVVASKSINCRKNYMFGVHYVREVLCFVMVHYYVVLVGCGSLDKAPVSDHHQIGKARETQDDRHCP
jgi:hypothetical protein